MSIATQIFNCLLLLRHLNVFKPRDSIKLNKQPKRLENSQLTTIKKNFKCESNF